MSVIDMVLDWAMKKPDGIAKITGRSPEQIKSAIKQGKTILPDILKNANNPESGAKILQNMGINKSFMNEQFNKYSKYASKIPGMDETKAKTMFNALTSVMGENKASPETSKEKTNKSSAERKKYPIIK